MLSAATAATIRAADRLGTPTELQMGRKRPQLPSVTLRHRAIWHVGGALTCPEGHEQCHSAPERGWMAPLSGECPFIQSSTRLIVARSSGLRSSVLLGVVSTTFSGTVALLSVVPLSACFPHRIDIYLGFLSIVVVL